MNPPTEASGVLAEEARRLVDALGGWSMPDATPLEADDPAPATSGHSPACTWCPVCRGVESIRSVDPEAVDRLADAVSALATAISEVGIQLRDRLGTPAGTRSNASSAATGGPPRPAGGAGPTAYDIPVFDDDLPHHGDLDDDDDPHDEVDDAALAADEEE